MLNIEQVIKAGHIHTKLYFCERAPRLNNTAIYDIRILESRQTADIFDPTEVHGVNPHKCELLDLAKCEIQICDSPEPEAPRDSWRTINETEINSLYEQCL